MVSSIIASIMLILGLLLLLWGFQYRRWLLPIISFGIGFTAAAGAAALISGEGLLSTPVSWAAALTSGAIYGLMTVRFKTVGLVLLAGILGYGLIVYLLLALDIDDSTVVALGGLLGALTFVLYSILYRNKKWLISALTSAAGSLSLLLGALILFDQLPGADFSSGSSSNFLLDNPLFWPTLALVVAIVGYVAQSRSSIGEQKPKRPDIEASPA